MLTRFIARRLPSAPGELCSCQQTPAITNGFFGERAASVYDERTAEVFDPAAVEPVVELLADLAEQGRALEFGIGTGWIALPLTGRGVPVVGIDNSEATVGRLRAKP
jgi:2-polyprenyl-3-methyl-5-hydroxy-6-metoxy-1,4-benzoquinol methylase